MRTTPFTASIVFAALSVAASAQTVFPEIEPNGDKSEATSVVCLSAGDALTGSATGGVLTLDSHPHGLTVRCSFWRSSARQSSLTTGVTT